MRQSGIQCRLKSFWIGLHYSSWHRRYCLNIIPCVTIWWTLPGGTPPRRKINKRTSPTRNH
jgi:hypothetical protein